VYTIFGVETLKSLPFITRKGFHELLLRLIRAAPDHLCKELNEFLQDNSLLIDPMTERPFEYKVILRECFPPVADEQDLAQLLELSDIANKKVMEIVREEQAGMEYRKKKAEEAEEARKDMQEEQALADLDLRLARQEYHNVMGGEYIDENGIRRGVPGAMNYMDSANW
jgi:hypothetical protein